MENEKLAREVETQAIFLARQIILLDLNFFKNNKTLYQKYDFFHKFQDYTLSGKSLSYTIKTNIRRIIPPYELDIYIPELNKAIELPFLTTCGSNLNSIVCFPAGTFKPLKT